MRHKVAGWKLGRNTSHRRSLLRNLVTSLILEERIDTTGPRFGDRNGGYLRIVRTGFQKGDGADKAFIELLGSEQVLDEKRQKRAEARAKKAEETKKAMEEAEAEQKAQAGVEGEAKEEKSE